MAGLRRFFSHAFLGSLLGGPVYDSHSPRLTNTFHIYLWLFLFFFPFSLQLHLQDYLDEEEHEYAVKVAYSISIGCLFFLMKTSNFFLHQLVHRLQPVSECDEQAVSQNTERRVSFAQMQVDVQPPESDRSSESSGSTLHEITRETASNEVSAHDTIATSTSSMPQDKGKGREVRDGSGGALGLADVQLHMDQGPSWQASGGGSELRQHTLEDAEVPTSDELQDDRDSEVEVESEDDDDGDGNQREGEMDEGRVEGSVLGTGEPDQTKSSLSLSSSPSSSSTSASVVASTPESPKLPSKTLSEVVDSSDDELEQVESTHEQHQKQQHLDVGSTNSQLNRPVSPQSLAYSTEDTGQESDVESLAEIGNEFQDAASQLGNISIGQYDGNDDSSSSMSYSAPSEHEFADVKPTSSGDDEIEYDDDLVSEHFFVDENGEIHHYSIPETDLIASKSLGNSQVSQSLEPPDLPRRRRGSESVSAVEERRGSDETPQQAPAQQKYEAKFSKWRFQLKYVPRNGLEQIFDRDTFFQATVAVALAFSTAWFGFSIRGNFKSSNQPLLWIAVASGQFSLCKSIQPDSSSPTPDNRMTGFSRALYFTLFAIAVSEIDDAASSLPDFCVLSECISTPDAALGIRDVLASLLLGFPLLFLLGLFPQVNTLVHTILEAVHRHAFGGTGTSSLQSALREVVQNVTFLAIISPIVYWAIVSKSAFSCGLVVAIPAMASFFASQFPSNSLPWCSLVAQLCTKPEWVTHCLPKAKVARALGESLCIGVLLLGVGCVFSLTEDDRTLYEVVAWLSILASLGLFYLLPNLRKPFPFLLFKEPIVDTEGDPDPPEGTVTSEIFKVERWTRLARFVISTCLIPLAITAAIAVSCFELEDNPSVLTVLLVSCSSIKAFRITFMNPSLFWASLLCSVSLLRTYGAFSEGVIIDLLILTILVSLGEEIYLKLQFIATYILPCNQHWGSPSHVVLQILWLPHTMLTLFQVVSSSIIGAPLFPLVGSSVFLQSYARPIKFWERHYQTLRLDDSVVKLSDSLDDPVDSLACNTNNLDSIFYEQLVTALERTLYRDISLGRYGTVSGGDIVALVGDRLTAIVHLIEVGNRFCTFQLRGLEFKGTYCQERELETIKQGMWVSSELCPKCCGPSILPLQRMAALRFSCWDVVNQALQIPSYNILIQSANSILQMYATQRYFLRAWICVTIYNLTQSEMLSEWMRNDDLGNHLKVYDAAFNDPDPVFTSQVDEDYDLGVRGVSFTRYESTFRAWIRVCLRHLKKATDEGGEGGSGGTSAARDARLEQFIVRLSFGLSLLARRSLHAHRGGVDDSFPYKVYSAFKGDLRISAIKDEWVFSEMDLLELVKSSLKLALRIHMDYIACDDLYMDNDALFDTISQYRENIVISHEGDSVWKHSVVTEAPKLMTVRRKQQESDESAELFEYQLLLLDLRLINFSVVKMNRECVRAFWSGQQHELVFLGNNNAERGSIQQMKSCLRNLMNQSSDLPVGYPIFVSALTPSPRLDEVERSVTPPPTRESFVQPIPL